MIQYKGVPMWAWEKDRFSPPYGIGGVARAIAKSIADDLDNRGCGTVMAPDGTEYQINVAVTLTPVLVDAAGEGDKSGSLRRK